MYGVALGVSENKENPVRRRNAFAGLRILYRQLPGRKDPAGKLYALLPAPLASWSATKIVFDVRPRAGLREPEACALCAMADAMYAFAEEDKRCRVVSASVGSVSETYAAPPELCAETIQSREGSACPGAGLPGVWPLCQRRGGLMAAPLQYPLCCQTVTLYHADPAAQYPITRTVVQGVHFDTRRRETAAGGSGPAGSAATAFLLVIPEKHAAFGRDYTLEPHDRVLAGTGPE